MSHAHLLLVDDEQQILRALRPALVAAGYEVATAETGGEALSHLAGEACDVVVLDLGLPRLDGLTVLKRWRAAGRVMPVLILTARDAWSEKVAGLNAGADDYLAKPFVMPELVARLQALVRRSQVGTPAGAEPMRLHLADLEVDLVRRRAMRAGRRLELTAKEFVLLVLFMRRAGQVLSRTELAQQVWDMHFDSDTNVVEVAIRRLRTKLDVPFPTPLLHTVRGMGYVLEERSP